MAKRPKQDPQPTPVTEGWAAVLNTPVAKRIYSEGLSKPIKSASALTTDILEGLRLFTAPFALAANYKDRLLKYLTECRNRVPVERQVESPPEIAGPLIERLRFIDDADPLKQLYLNLLTASIDRERQEGIHPAFPLILSQLSSDEAKLIACVRQGITCLRCDSGEIDRVLWVKLRWPNKEPENEAEIRANAESEGELPLAFPARFEMYIQRLAFLLIAGGLPVLDSTVRWYYMALTNFGHMFATACE